MYADVQDGRTSQHPRPDNNVILNIIWFFFNSLRFPSTEDIKIQTYGWAKKSYHGNPKDRHTTADNLSSISSSHTVPHVSL